MSSPAPARHVLRGRQEPRVLTIPPSAVGSLADDAHALWDLTGRRLDPWQETACEPLYAVDAAGNWAAKEYGLVVCRQVGKGEILTEYDLAHLYLWPKPDGEPKVILHTAHEYPTVWTHFRKVRARVLSTPWMRRQLVGGGKETSRGISGISTGMGKMIFELQSGNLLILQTRTANAGVGFTVDNLVIDEAQQSPAETMDALLFTQNAVPNSQVVYTGTVPTEVQDGSHFEAVRDRGRAQTYPRTGWVEFSPDGSDDPDAAESIRMDDRRVWVQAIPGLGIRTSEEDVEDMFNALGKTNPESFRQQQLSIWPNRRPDEADKPLNDLDLTVWEANVTDLRTGTGVVLAVALGRGGTYASIGAAWRTPAGKVLVEHMATETGTLWVPARLKELRDRLHASLIVLDERNCSPILSDLERAGVKFLKMNTTEVGGALTLFVESVNAGDVQHPPQDELTISLRNAEPRPMGRSGLSTWDQGNPLEPVTPAQSVTLALWGLKKNEARRSSHTPVTPGALGVDTAAGDDYTLTGSTNALNFLRR